MSAKPDHDKFDVIIVGSGVAGLTAAYDLLQNKPDCKLVILEARGE